MIKVDIEIQVEKNPAVCEPGAPGARGDWYLILGNGRLLGAYYCDQGELTLEPIPPWLPTMENQIKKEVEKVLEVQVQSVSMMGRDHT